MRRKRKEKQSSVAQQILFQGTSLTPSVPVEFLPEIHAALADLLLDAARPSEKEAADEHESC